MRIFVYGTLKRNFCRHFALESEVFVAEAHTQPKYRMYNVGTYPGLVDSPENGLSIQGEVYDVSEAGLQRLDEIEGVSEGLYERRAIDLISESLGAVQAYFYLPSVLGYPDCGRNWR